MNGSTMIIRTESPADIQEIRSVVAAAFQDASHSRGTEADIVDSLRASRALAVSLVAEEDGKVVGYVAFSPVVVNAQNLNWFGLGPLAVLTERRRHGIADALVRDGLKRLERAGAHGCVVLGDPTYYRRFGFKSDRSLSYGEAPVQYLQHLALVGEAPRGVVEYHAAFRES